MSRLRIALVAEAMDTGLAQLLFLLAAGFVRRGHEVHLLHSRQRTEAGAVSRLRDELGVKCVAIDMVRAVHKSDLAAVLAVRGYFRQHGPFDIIHGHSSKGGAVARLASIGLPGARIYTPHAFYTLSPHLSPLSRLLFATIERLLACLCQVIICSSAMERRHAEALGISPKRLIVIPNGIEPPILSPTARGRFGFPAETSVIVGFVGRLEHQKAPEILLKAMARAVERVPGVGLVMIGDGHLAPAVKAMADELRITDNIRWLGRQLSPEYLASFDILAMPSRYEGFSLMPLEAMHARLPIICTPVGGVEETVQDGVTGLIVPIDDDKALGDAIVALACDPVVRKAMGEAAYRQASSFLADRMINATEQLYLAACIGAPRMEVFGDEARPPSAPPAQITPGHIH
jgi:glycosyltransferase involved in cell wall biosynthesis